MSKTVAREPVLRPAGESMRSGAEAVRFSRMLMATDLSARSDRALERAIQLARCHKAHLTVLHVVDEELPETVLARQCEAAVSEIQLCLAKFGAGADIQVTACVRPGRDYRDILAVAQSDNTDLIILGRHRDESEGRTIRGTTMERVLRHGVHPVLVVSERPQDPYRKVMVGVDFSIFSRSAIRMAFSIAPDAAFHFVHAFQIPFEGFLQGRDIRRELMSEYDDRLARLVGEEIAEQALFFGSETSNERKARRILRDGEVMGVLWSEAARLRPDLLVIGTHGRAGIAHALLGSVAESLLNRPPCDVLAVKAW